MIDLVDLACSNFKVVSHRPVFNDDSYCKGSCEFMWIICLSSKEFLFVPTLEARCGQTSRRSREVVLGLNN